MLFPMSLVKLTVVPVAIIFKNPVSPLYMYLFKISHLNKNTTKINDLII